jgi:enoyl-CoA hydratase/carnithine racemase
VSDGARLVDVRADGPVCVVGLRRQAKLNALSAALELALDEAIAGPAVSAARAVVITGGRRAFSAGADVTEMRDLDPAAIAAYYRATGGVYERVAAMTVPTVAAIEGWRLGGGLELALACDFRVAGAGATFGLPEVGIGILPSSGGTHRLVRLAGAARAKELVLLGERIPAERAAAAGLVTEVAATGAALERALEIARRLAGRPPLAVTVAKQAIDAMAESSRDAGLLVERLGYGLLAQTADAREAAAAFTEKRPARFEGR